MLALKSYRYEQSKCCSHRDGRAFGSFNCRLVAALHSFEKNARVRTGSGTDLQLGSKPALAHFCHINLSYSSRYAFANIAVVACEREIRVITYFF